VFGAGGGTSSYQEVETAELIVLWGSNAREAHPIFFHRILKGIDNGAKLYAIDPRRTSSAKFADVWLGLDVGSDIALANGVAREIIHAGLTHTEFIDNATSGFEAYAATVEPWTLERTAAITKLPAEHIRELAHDLATAKSAQICWTLGITEHHTGVDNVLSLINLALLSGHVGRWGSGLVPLRGQNNVQGGGDMGAIPARLPGFGDITDPAVRAGFEQVWNAAVPPTPGWHLSEMFEAMHSGALRALWVIGENPVDSEADGEHARAALGKLDTLVVQDLYLTRTARMADVVLPAAAAWAETDGTVTNSERRVQRVRRAVAPPGDARDDLAIVFDIARRLGHDWGAPDAEVVWNELRSVSPNHAGMSYNRLAALGGLQWPCTDETDPGAPFLHGRLWATPREGPAAPFVAVEWKAPLDELSPEYPLRLTTGRVLDSYNTGVQTERFNSPIRAGHTLDLDAVDARRYGVGDGARVRVVSRRGSVEMVIRIVEGQPAGLAFTTFHFSELVDVNVLTSDAWDPKSGTAEFKATAIRIEPLGVPVTSTDAAR
jgi:formate dehydrogenase major subunit